MNPYLASTSQFILHLKQVSLALCSRQLLIGWPRTYRNFKLMTKCFGSGTHFVFCTLCHFSFYLDYFQHKHFISLLFFYW